MWHMSLDSTGPLLTFSGTRPKLFHAFRDSLDFATSKHQNRTPSGGARARERRGRRGIILLQYLTSTLCPTNT